MKGSALPTVSVFPQAGAAPFSVDIPAFTVATIRVRVRHSCYHGAQGRRLPCGYQYRGQSQHYGPGLRLYRRIAAAADTRDAKVTLWIGSLAP